MDLTTQGYADILDVLLKHGFIAYTLSDYLSNDQPTTRFVLLRHDADFDARKAIPLAALEAERGLRATYYFRGPHHRRSFNIEIMQQIAAMGHEIGYHYETLDSCEGNFEEAIRLFEAQLQAFRDAGFNIDTVSAHGNPRVKKNNYKTNEDLIHHDLMLCRRNKLLGDAGYPRASSDLIYISDVGVRFRGIGTARHLRELLSKDSLKRLYLLTHPDYWSRTQARAVTIWMAAKFLRTTRGNKIIANARAIMR
jgi:hypothetical protein